MSRTSFARMYSVRSFFSAVSRFRMLHRTAHTRRAGGTRSASCRGRGGAGAGTGDGLHEGLEYGQLVFWNHRARALAGQRDESAASPKPGAASAR